MGKFFLHGRMMSGTKKHVAGRIEVYNANIFTQESGKVWFGDLDLTSDSDLAKLREFAASLGEELYILRERDGRFEHENSPVWNNAIARITPDGAIIIHADNRN